MTAPDAKRTTRARVGRAGAAVGVIGALVLASPQLLDFLHFWEDGGKPIRTVYADKLAGGLPTACGGITKYTSSRPVIVGEVWTEEECAAALADVVRRDQVQLLDCFKVKPPQSVFDAFSSHAHNFGVPTTCSSTAMVLVNNGDIAGGCRSLAYKPDGSPNWSGVKTGRLLPSGRPELRFVQGLHNRRIAEMRMCLKGLQ